MSRAAQRVDLLAQRVGRHRGARAVAAEPALQRQAGLGEVELELHLLAHHRRQLGLLRLERFHRGHLVLELAEDERGAPAQRGLGHGDVGVDVVADVEDLLAGDAEPLLHLVRVAADVHAGLPDAAGARTEQPVLGRHLEQRHAAREEVGLAGVDDDQVEQVAPARPLGHRRVEGEGQHPVGVAPVRVRDQHELLARLALVREGEDELGVALHVALGVGDDLGLERALEVRLVGRAADPVVEVGVAHRPGQGRRRRGGRRAARRRTPRRARRAC